MARYSYGIANRTVSTEGICPFADEYLTFKGGKLSKSRGTAVEVPYFLSKYDPDALRF